MKILILSSRKLSFRIRTISPTKVAQSNVRYLIDDFEKEWLDSDLDFVFGRFLAGSVEDWPQLMRQSFENLKAGGWAEFQDWDTMVYSTTLPQEEFEKSELWKFHRDTISLQESRGRDIRPGPKLESWVKEAGFINVNVQKFRMQLGHWDTSTSLEVGQYSRVAIFLGRPVCKSANLFYCTEEGRVEKLLSDV